MGLEEVQRNLRLTSAHYFNHPVSTPQFIAGEREHRRNEFTTLDNKNKILTKSEGPYMAVEIASLRFYYLEDYQCVRLPLTPLMSSITKIVRLKTMLLPSSIKDITYIPLALIFK